MFYAFFCPYMVKWHNSGIIKRFILNVELPLGRQQISNLNLCSFKIQVCCKHIPHLAPVFCKRLRFKDPFTRKIFFLHKCFWCSTFWAYSVLTDNITNKIYTGPPTFRTAWFSISCHDGSSTLCSLDVEASFCSAMASIFLADWWALHALSYFNAAFWVSICD